MSNVSWVPLTTNEEQQTKSINTNSIDFIKSNVKVLHIAYWVDAHIGLNFFFPFHSFITVICLWGIKWWFLNHDKIINIAWPLPWPRPVNSRSCETENICGFLEFFAARAGLQYFKKQESQLQFWKTSFRKHPQELRACTISSRLQQTVGTGLASSFQQLEEHTQEPSLAHSNL